MTNSTPHPSNPRKNKDGLNHDDPGLAYITHPYQMTLEEEKALLEEARQRRTALLQHELEDNDWYSRLSSFQGVTVTSKTQPDGPFCLTKGVCEAPKGMTLSEIRQQFESNIRSSEALLRTFHRIDPMNLHMMLVAQVKHRELLQDQEELRVLWGSFYVAPLISDRDFCFVSHTSRISCPVTGEEVYCVNFFSIPETNPQCSSWSSTVVPDLQSQTGRVRALIQTTGYIFRPIQSSSLKDNDNDNDNKNTEQDEQQPVSNTSLSSSSPSSSSLKITFVGQCDPKGLLPAAIVNFASVSQALNVGRMRDSFQLAQQVNNQLSNKIDKIYVPLDCHHLPRRGGTIGYSIPLVVVKSNEDEATTTNLSSSSSSRISNNNILTVHLVVHCDHAVTVRRVLTTQQDVTFHQPDNNEGNKKDNSNACQLMAGESMEFGGGSDPLLDLTFHVKLNVHIDSSSNNDSRTLELEFINSGWRNATLCLPATTSITAVEPSSSSSPP